MYRWGPGWRGRGRDGCQPLRLEITCNISVSEKNSTSVILTDNTKENISHFMKMSVIVADKKERNFNNIFHRLLK